ncbi:MAG: hypothetical protein ABIG89_04530 [Candidatus Woesearchaeota archaeon]
MKIICSADGNRGNMSSLDGIVAFNEEALARLSQDLPFLLVAGTSKVGKTSIMKEVGQIRTIDLYSPPKFSAHTRVEGSQRLPSMLPEDASLEEATDLLKSWINSIGLAYCSYGELAYYANSMYDDSHSRILNLQSGSPNVVFGLNVRYSKIPNFLPILIDAPFKNVKARLQQATDSSRSKRSKHIKKYWKEFRDKRQQFISVFTNQGNPNRMGRSQIASQIASAAGKVNALLRFYLEEWQSYKQTFDTNEQSHYATITESGNTPDYLDMFQRRKKRFHTAFVESLLKSLYGVKTAQELEQKITTYNEYLNQYDTANRRDSIYSGIEMMEVVELGALQAVRMGRENVYDALRVLSPTEVKVVNDRKVIISHNNLSGNDQYRQRLKEMFKNILSKRFSVYTPEYLNTHLNGSLVASLTDDTNLDYLHAVEFRF